MISPTSAAKKKSRAGAPLTRKREQPFSLSDRSDTYVTWPVQILFLFSRRFLPHRRPIQFGPPTDCVSARNARTCAFMKGRFPTYARISFCSPAPGLHVVPSRTAPGVCSIFSALITIVISIGGGGFSLVRTPPSEHLTQLMRRPRCGRGAWNTNTGGKGPMNETVHFIFFSCLVSPFDNAGERKSATDHARRVGTKNRNKLETKKKCFQLTGIVFLAVGQPFSIYSRFESANVTV